MSCSTCSTLSTTPVQITQEFTLKRAVALQKAVSFGYLSFLHRLLLRYKMQLQICGTFTLRLKEYLKFKKQLVSRNTHTQTYTQDAYIFCVGFIFYANGTVTQSKQLCDPPVEKHWFRYCVVLFVHWCWFHECDDIFLLFLPLSPSLWGAGGRGQPQWRGPTWTGPPLITWRLWKSTLICFPWRQPFKSRANKRSEKYAVMLADLYH